MTTIEPPGPSPASAWAIICRAAARSQVERAPHGDVDRAAEAVHVGLIERLAIAVGGVAHRDVEPAERRHGFVDQPLDRGLLGHVAGQQDGPAAGALDFGHGARPRREARWR